MSKCLVLLLRQNHLRHFYKTSNISIYQRLNHYRYISKIPYTVNNLHLRNQNINLQVFRFNHTKKEEHKEEEGDDFEFPWYKVFIALALAAINFQVVMYLYDNYVKGKFKKENLVYHPNNFKVIIFCFHRF